MTIIEAFKLKNDMKGRLLEVDNEQYLNTFWKCCGHILSFLITFISLIKKYAQLFWTKQKSE